MDEYEWHLLLMMSSETLAYISVHLFNVCVVCHSGVQVLQPTTRG